MGIWSTRIDPLSKTSPSSTFPLQRCENVYGQGRRNVAGRGGAEMRGKGTVIINMAKQKTHIRGHYWPYQSLVVADSRPTKSGGRADGGGAQRWVPPHPFLWLVGMNYNVREASREGTTWYSKGKKYVMKYVYWCLCVNRVVTFLVGRDLREI